MSRCGDNPRVAPLQLALHLQLVLSLLNGALRLLHLAFCFQHFHLCGDQRRASTSAIFRRAVSSAASCLELSSLKSTASFDGDAMIDTDLGDTPRDFGDDRNCPEVQCRAAGRRVEIEDQGNE